MKQDLKPGDGGGGVKRKADWETNFKGARTMSYQSSRSSLYDQIDGGKMTEEEDSICQSQNSPCAEHPLR